ncbi:hypothetical protein B7Y94_05685 [Candidatus Saccharibacteria bacterium 32-49-12]|nr:MAG: hypothetical protein B7Y94_05685 [Candidatus Saccharibacteria bacterium 32-49-12]
MSENSLINRPTQPNHRRHITIALALALWVYIGFTIAQLLIMGALWLAGEVGVELTTVNDAVFTTVLGGVIYGITLLIVVGVPWLLKGYRTSLNQIGLDRLPAWRDILISPFGFIGYLMLTATLTFLMMQIFPAIDFLQEQDTGFGQLVTSTDYILAFVMLVVIAPVAEEVLFRGYLFGKLRQHVPLWGAIIVTSLLFGAVHGQWNVAIDTFALSVVMCLVVVWSKSIWPAILIHMLKNGIAFYFLFINPQLLNTIGGSL